jgi:hypothetical protein
MKKGRNLVVSALFILRIAPEFSQAFWRNVLSASEILYRLGFFDRGLMIPAVAAQGFVDPRSISEIGIAVAAAAERRPAAGRELIDLCRSLT